MELVDRRPIVMLSPGGRAASLDFGIARVVGGAQLRVGRRG
jgi:hypothetical protein